MREYLYASTNALFRQAIIDALKTVRTKNQIVYQSRAALTRLSSHFRVFYCGWVMRRMPREGSAKRGLESLGEEGEAVLKVVSKMNPLARVRTRAGDTWK